MKDSRTKRKELADCDLRRLNTPSPIMSPYLTGPNCPDPFRSREHPVMVLGSGTWTTGASCPAVLPQQFVVQLTEEEDQAITNLLKLYHCHPWPGRTCWPVTHGGVEQNVFSGFRSAELAHKPRSIDRMLLLSDACWWVEHATRWSKAELEAAEVLVSRFNGKQGQELPRTAQD